MKHTYDYHLISNIKKRKLVQVGACDGVMADNVRRYILSHQIESLLIEPISYNYNLLVDNYKDCDFVRHTKIAVDEQAGYREMSFFHKIPGKDHMIGVASFYDIDWKREFPNHVMNELVECDTLNNILQKFNMLDANIFQIDTEGHDYHIVKQIDFDKHANNDFYMVSEHFWDQFTGEFESQKKDLVEKLRKLKFKVETIYGKRGKQPSGLQVIGTKSE